MNLRDFYSMLEAPLVNPRWSWGAVRNSDGTLFLRVWEDETKTLDGKEFVRVLRSRSAGVASKPGRRERLQHLELMRSGARCFLVMCEAVDTKARPRRIRRFNSQDVFAAGRVVQEFENDLWVERLHPVPVRDVTSG